MPEPSTDEVTQLLRAWNDGDQAALDKLIPLVDHAVTNEFLCSRS